MNSKRSITMWLTAALLASTAAAEPPPRVLGPTLNADVVAQANDAATVAARVVRPDFARLDELAWAHLMSGKRGRFVIDLFPGLDLEAEVIDAEARAGGGTTLYARLPGTPLGSARFTSESGILSGSVDFPGGNYMIERQADGNYQVTLKAPQLFAPEASPRAAFAPAMPATPFAGPDVAPDVPADSGRLIDIMVIWTPAAQSAAGGLSQMQNLAQAAVDDANLAYNNSGVAQRLRLVHRQQVAYTERTTCAIPNAFDCALDDVTNNGDGYMDSVHTLRNTHGADMVALLINDSAYCGLAWLGQPPSAGYAFSVTAWNCAVGNKSFVHEVGHNMGAHHDPYVAPGPGAYAYSHGIVNLASRWRTVMSYNDQCIATPPGTSCNRISYLSNPKLVAPFPYPSTPMGDAGVRNNAHTLNKTAKSIASFRATSGLHPVPQRFADVPTSHPFYGYIEFFAQAGITSGCVAGQFCPANAVNRRQMAVFLERTMKSSVALMPNYTGFFADVAMGSQFDDHIEGLRLDGITTGCGAGIYCPEQAVTRGEMATFIMRARCGTSYTPTVGPQIFADVPLSHPFVGHIHKMYQLGFTNGCATSPLRYCPDVAVTRGQMAAFIERAYPFLTPTEVCAP